MSTKAERTLGTAAEQLESRPPKRSTSRSSSRRFRSSRNSISKQDDGPRENQSSHSRSRTHLKALLPSSNATQSSRPQVGESASETSLPGTYASADGQMTFSGRTTRRASPSRTSTAPNWPLPVMPSKSRGSWLLGHGANGSNAQQLRNPAPVRPNTTPPTLPQLTEKRSLRAQLSKLSLRSRKSQEVINPGHDHAYTNDTEPLPAPYSEAYSLPASSRQSVRHSTRNSQSFPSAPTKSKSSRKRSKQKPKYWWDKFDEDLDGQDDSHLYEHAEERPQSPPECSNENPEDDSFPETSQTEHEGPVANDDTDADTLQGLLPATDRSRIKLRGARHEHAVPSPRNLSPMVRSKISPILKEDDDHLKVIRRMPSKSTISSSIHHGTSVLSLSDSDDDSDAAEAAVLELAKRMKPMLDLSKEDSKQLRRRSQNQKKRQPKPFNPETFRRAVLADLDESGPGTSSTVPSTYLADSSEESSDAHTSPSSPALIDPNTSTRTSLLSSSSTYFPAPPNGLKGKRQLPFPKGSPEGPFHSKATLYAPRSPSHRYKRSSAQSRSTSHHLMTVTAEEAMLLSSMRKKRASMQQQLFSEGYRTALQEELRIMEGLRVEELPSTPPAAPTVAKDASFDLGRSNTSHSAPAGRVNSLFELERGRKPEVKRATSASVVLQTMHIPGTVAAELAALDQLIEAEAEAEAQAAKGARMKFVPSSATLGYPKSAQDTFVLQSSSEETVVLADQSEKAPSPTRASLARRSSSRDFAEHQTSSNLPADEFPSVPQEPTGSVSTQSHQPEPAAPKEHAFPENHDIPRPVVADENKLTRLPSRSKDSSRRSSRIPRSVQQQQQLHLRQTSSNLQSARSSYMPSEQDRHSGGSITRDLIAAWDELGGARSAISSLA